MSAKVGKVSIYECSVFESILLNVACMGKHWSRIGLKGYKCWAILNKQWQEELLNSERGDEGANSFPNVRNMIMHGLFIMYFGQSISAI